MKKITLIKFPHFFFLSILFLFLTLVSCGGSQSAYQEDGIYDSETNNERVLVKDEKSDYYQKYFSEERNNYYLQEDIVTDIDDLAYEGNDSIQTDTVYVVEEYQDGKPPWEKSSSNVSVSFHFGVGFGGYYNPWYWGRPWYGYGWGWGGYYPPYYPPVWGPYPPYYPGYPGYPGYGWHYSTYGKRYNHNTSRLNTSRFYNRSSIAANNNNRYRRNYSSNRYSNSNSTNNNSVRNRSNYNKRSNTNNSNTRNRSSNYNKSPQNRSNQNYNRSRPSYQRSAPSYNRSGSTRGGSSRGRGHSSIDNNTKTIYAKNSKNNTYTPVKIAKSKDGKNYRIVNRNNTNNYSSNRKFVDQKQRKIVYVNSKGEVIKKPQNYSRAKNGDSKNTKNSHYSTKNYNKKSNTSTSYSNYSKKKSNYSNNNSRSTYSNSSKPSNYSSSSSRASYGGGSRSSGYSRSSSRTR